VSDLVLALVPEMIGLVATPGAIVACLLLLTSRRPVGNVAILAGVFLAVYGALAALVLATGRVGGAEDSDGGWARGWLSIVIGAAFLVVAALVWRREPEVPMTPGVHRRGLAERLRDPSRRELATGAATLALVNPNVVILASGVGIVVTSDVDADGQLVGVALLLAASMLDFVVPSVLYVASGERGRRGLRRATDWLLARQAVVGAVVLAALGVTFVLRGLGHVL